ncbi:AAA domain (dynein-related subfamily) [Legionella moravica]|uniref:AAA domain (Dynein-related subfamily) n=1 Tax=Legionella moravica TaxID=39962 RepID=A0A378K199_9GAMM|nr:AAA family ATPase [Legionella moravica]KTD32109.1 AAA domain (dynein-related subfamily) [Legionella moravica]STX63029.1 AAA domain (dynein-related subfamily) [Legionella moravica]
MLVYCIAELNIKNLIPNEFYYTQTQQSPEYTRTPTGNLSVMRLIECQDAYWIKPIKQVKKQKKLIVQDWTISYWTERKTRIVKEAFNELLDQGFTLYFRHKDSLQVVTQSNLGHFLDERHNTKQSFTHVNKILNESSIMLGCSIDELFVLDDHWISCLIEQDAVPSIRRLDINYFRRLPLHLHDPFFSFIRITQPSLQQLIVYKQNVQNNLLVQEILKRFPDLSINMKPIHICFHNPEYQRLAPSITFLGCDDRIKPITAPLPVMPELMVFAIRRIASSESIRHLMAAAPNLENVSIDNLNQEELFESFNKNLTSIEIINSRITTQQYKQIIVSFPKLKILQLSSSVIEGGTLFDGSTPKNLSINLLSLRDVTMPKSILNELVLCCPELKSFIYSNPAGGSHDEIKKWNLSNLNEIHLSNIRFKTDELKHLILTNPNLKSMSLQSLSLSGCTDDLPVLSQLEMLHLGYCVLNEDELNNVFACAPNIQYLVLYSITDGKKNHFFQNHSKFKNLSRLHSLTLIEATSRTIEKNLIHLVPFLSQLKTITLEEDPYRPLVYIEQMNRMGVSVKFLTCNRKASQSSEPERTLYQQSISFHNYRSFLNHTPTAKDYIFQYTKPNGSLSQSMIVQQLAQYLTLKQKDVVFIPKIMDGICTPLTQLFTQLHFSEFKQFEARILQWDGTLSSLNQVLIEQFELLWELVKNHLSGRSSAIPLTFIGANLEQIENQSVPSVPIHELDGDNWVDFILEPLRSEDKVSHSLFSNKNLERKQKIDSFNSFLKSGCRLFNPWHAIAIKRIDKDQWQFYDPNSIEGAQTVPRHNLAKYIKRSLGTQVSIETVNELLVPQIENSDAFIQKGGLLSLCESSNYQDILQLLGPDQAYSPEALQGILLRTMKGVPAWYEGLFSPRAATLTHQLLAQFIQKHPVDYRRLLTKSVKLLTPQQKSECIQLLTSQLPSYSALNAPIDFPPVLGCQVRGIEHSLYDVLHDVLRGAGNKHYFKNELKTWYRPVVQMLSTQDYCEYLIQGDRIKNTLIEFGSTQSLNAFRLALELIVKNRNYSVYYAHSPQDLICSAPFIQRNGHQGTLQRGPGGAFYDFLIKSHNNSLPSILIVNYDTFSVEDLVRFNGLLDKKRCADGVAVPETTLIFGLININKPDCYQGSDFYSRFNRVEKNPLSEVSLAESINRIHFVEQQASAHVINLFNSSDWKQLLLGSWVLEGTRLRFKEGALAHLEGTIIELRNAPWNHDEFKLFWQAACYPGATHFPGSNLPIPYNLQLIESNGYDLSGFMHRCSITNTSLSSQVSDDSSVEHSDLTILNSYSLYKYFNHYQFSDEYQSLVLKPGLIETNQGGALSVCLTHTISVDEWARLLTECECYQVYLYVSISPGVVLPDEFHVSVETLSSVTTPWVERQEVHTEVIVSNDPDYTQALILSFQPDCLVLDVSELSSADLLERLSGSLNKDTLEFQFSRQPSFLKDTLKNNKRILLKGTCSQELEQQLASLLMQRQLLESAPGQLILLTQNENSFQFMPRTTHKVSADDLRAFFGSLPHDGISDTFITLRARRRYRLAFPEMDSKQAWAGINNLEPQSLKLKELNPLTSAKEVMNYDDDRQQRIRALLCHSPYVLLTGFSGAGKTTFVLNELVRNGEKLYVGFDQIKNWIDDNETDDYRYLFLDEVNLEGSQLSVFEGLFNEPPALLIDGEIKVLSSRHKLICAANPLSYGGERRVPAFFMRHGNALVFDPLPTALLYEKIIKPVFAAHHYSMPQIEQLSKQFLELYRFLVECSSTDILISPRELQMMALLTLNYLRNNPEVDPEQVAAHYAYTLGEPLVPEQHQAEFHERFKPITPLIIKASHQQYDGGSRKVKFQITPSRYPAHQLLTDLLSLHEFRKTQAVNDEQRYGGLGGIIFEGDPGLGKSELVFETLIEQGFREAEADIEYQEGEAVFYKIPVSMDVAEKESLLLKAFNQGAIVVIDEINSSTMLERLLNSLLMGSDLNGNRPTRPGFMLIGTQNPNTMAGRRTLGNALSRRMITLTLSDYPAEEIQFILEQKGYGNQTAYDLTAAFKKNQHLAAEKELTPRPTFRDLMMFAKKFKKANPTLQNNSSAKRSYIDNRLSQESVKRIKHDIPASAQGTEASSSSSSSSSAVSSYGLFQPANNSLNCKRTRTMVAAVKEPRSL